MGGFGGRGESGEGRKKRKRLAVRLKLKLGGLWLKDILGRARERFNEGVHRRIGRKRGVVRRVRR